MIVRNGSGNSYGVVTDVAAGSLLRSGGVATAPAYTTWTIPATIGIGEVWYCSASNVVTALAAGTSGMSFLSGGAGAPTWNYPILIGRTGATTTYTGGANSAGTTKGVNFTALPTDTMPYILTAGGLTITLATSDADGTEYTFQDVSGSESTVTIQRDGSGSNVNGGANVTVAVGYMVRLARKYSSNWYVGQ
jgi:hypothetical protein